LVLSAHLGACAACRAQVRLAEAVGGVLLEELPPAELAPDALERALARLDVRLEPSPRREEAPRPPDWIEVPHEVLVAARRRKRWAAPGVWVAPVTFDRATGARSYLLRVGAGMAVPRHTHRGSEYVCVVKGAFVDTGGVHRPADFAESDESVEHRPRVTAEGECVCLIAADHPLVPRDLLGRMMQPLVGI
ncbi:MAG: ChrR family anti-sigma-E factor, partial [Caulobacteraceae bacterium]